LYQHIINFPLLLLPYLAVVFLHISARGDGFLNRYQFHMASDTIQHPWLAFPPVVVPTLYLQSALWQCC